MRNASELADEDLMALARRGDADAFQVIYDRHATVAFSLAYRITGNLESAEDVVQEAFLGVWRSATRYDDARASVRTWVLGIVHNRAIDHVRRAINQERRRAAGDADAISELLPAKEQTHVEAARREEAGEVRAALAQLPPEQSKVIELAYFGGFTHSQIATMLDVPSGTIKGRMRLGLDKLRLHLGALAPEPLS
jgi:RNA polymerase sigma-70 factor (ECF subfamily)